MLAGSLKRAQSGQSVLEYVLLLVMIAGLSSLVLAIMPRVFDAMEKPITTSFKITYKYGDPKSCGYDDDGPPCNTGAPQNHIRYDVPGNFRLFGRGR